MEEEAWWREPIESDDPDAEVRYEVDPELWPIYEDFRNFLFIVWQHLNLPDPTPLQYDIARFLQYSPKRCVIEAFRGVGKSWVTSAFVVWVLMRNPQLKILVVSASKERADSFSIFTKRLINELPECAHLAPRANQRNSNVAFDVGPAEAAHAPSVKSLGITSQLAGSRADIIIADDIEVPTNSATQQLRDKLAESIKEFDAILTPKPTSKIIYLGTPQSEESIYNRLPGRGYMIQIWPARYPNTEAMKLYVGEIAPTLRAKMEAGEAKEGEPTDPLRFNDLELRERELSYGRSGFALQFMLQTTLSDQDKHPLKLSDLIVANLNVDMAPAKLLWSKQPDNRMDDLPSVGLAGDYYYRPSWESKDYYDYEGSVMAIDPSGRGKDETSFSVVKMLNGLLYNTAGGGMTGGYDMKTLEKLAYIAKEQKVNLIIIESNFGDGMFTQLFSPVLERIYPCTIEEVRHNTQKEKRIIDTLEPVMNQHRLVVDEALIRQDYDNIPEHLGESAVNYRLFYQMTRLTSERDSLAHDDRLEALAMAVAYWVEQMATDVDKAEDKRKEEWLEAELQRFVDNAIGSGGRPANNNWMDTYGRRH